MARKLPRNAVAVGNAKGLDVLGTLATFTFPDEPKKATKVIRSWNDNGLDINLLPDVRSASHVFQSACRSVETRRRESKAGVQVEVDCVVDDATTCAYQVTRMTRDKANQLIEHSKSMTVVLDKKLDKIDVRELEDYEALRGLEEAIRSHFNKHAKDIPGQKVRNAVRDTLLGIGAQNLRRKAGGLYFVPEKMIVGNDILDTMPTLDGLRGFLAEMYDDRADFYTIPLVADEAADKMVAKHFTINVNDRAREALERAVARANVGLGERGLIRDDFMDGLYQEQRKLITAVRQFDSLVTLEKSEIESNMRDLDDAVRKLEALRDQGEAQRAKAKADKAAKK